MSPTTPMRPGTANPPPSTGGSTFYSPVKRVRAASPTPLPRRTIQESPDAMDWNPTTANETKWEIPSHRLPPPPQPSFTLPPSSAQLQRQNQYNNNNRSPSPSPFTGTLPPAPRAPAQRIVSSLMQQPLRPTPPAQISREQFFAHRLNPGQAAVPAGREFEKVAAPGYRLGSPRYAPMAPQRFFVADEATGLEVLMAGGFRLEDEPERARARRFYEEERRRGIEEEKEARRRGGSAEGSAEGRSARGGFGGLSLG
ncbi:uncharacterized protein LAJ45_10654 [Morchella importuna]|uniref:uncharacterized protein n=1 Tax=Morchella importuna TaxID=1174673 RepID=UPI001E8D604F|nr:uncharacterized protein LAJ45_10654 [Morchella importuna]KAH8145371.1 hypothetical protein LAJ45_10654 [Morchella importuna]